MSAAHHPSLRDRVVLITGGGRGLGREMALALVEAGARVLVTSAREVAELAEVEEEARAIAGPDRLVGFSADVRRWEDCTGAVEKALETFGALHVLVNNAGRGLLLISPNFVTEPVKFYEGPIEGWREIIETNVIGPYLMTRAATPHLVAQGFGKIINISTSDVTMVRKGYSPYGPSKAALEACSVVWAKDLEGTGVSVNVLLPGGATDTRFLPDMPDKRGSDGQLLSPALMRAPALWLCSDAANGSTGERYIAKLWDAALPPDEAAQGARQPRHDVPAVM